MEKATEKIEGFFLSNYLIKQTQVATVTKQKLLTQYCIYL